MFTLPSGEVIYFTSEAQHSESNKYLQGPFTPRSMCLKRLGQIRLTVQTERLEIRDQTVLSDTRVKIM